MINNPFFTFISLALLLIGISFGAEIEYFWSGGVTDNSAVISFASDREAKIKMRLKGTEIFYKSLNPFQKWFGNKNSNKEIGNVLENITDHYFVLKKTSQMADNLALKHSINDYYVSLEIIEKRICRYFNLLLKEKKVTNYFKMGPIRKRRIVGKRVSLFKNCPHNP